MKRNCRGLSGELFALHDVVLPKIAYSGFIIMKVGIKITHDVPMAQLILTTWFF